MKVNFFSDYFQANDGFLNHMLVSSKAMFAKFEGALQKFTKFEGALQI